MPAPKGHAPYPGCEKGSAFGYLGKPQDSYTEEDLHHLGKELIEYISKPSNIWLKGYPLEKGIQIDHFYYLVETYPIFEKYHKQAKSIQELKLVTDSYWKSNGADGNHARFILARQHGWKEEITTNTTGTFNVITTNFSDQESNE